MASHQKSNMPLNFESTANGNQFPKTGSEQVAGSSRFERWLLRKVLAFMNNPAIQIQMWDGRLVPPRIGKSVATLWIGDRASLYALLRNPDLHFGELYCEGRIQIEGNLIELLEETYRHKRRLLPEGPIFDTLRTLWQRRPSNTLGRSRENIHHHYDLGNDFYQMWLDENMQYTCAYFSEKSMSLEEAQLAKMDHICRKLRLRPGDSVVEAGCGWGYLALHMAKEYGVRVKAYNISHEQILYARDRAKQEGFHDRVDYIEDDYRNITGEFDVFVSVGMLEHVGPNNYKALGQVIDRCLTTNGRGLIHSIGRNQPQLMNAWINKRIFPGAHPPTLREMMRVFEPYNFSVLDAENLRLHYAKTLEHWLERFEAHRDIVAPMFDERVVRAWRLYLSGSIAAFATGYLQLFQVLFARGHNNAVPWTRQYIYETA